MDRLVILTRENRIKEIIQLFEQYISVIKELTTCKAIGISILRKNNNHSNITHQAYDGFNSKFYKSECSSLIKLGQHFCENIIRERINPKLQFYTEAGSFYTNNTNDLFTIVKQKDIGIKCTICKTFGYKSIALIPIRYEQQILGLVHIADTKKNILTLEMVKLLEEAGIHLGINFKLLSMNKD